MCVKSLSDVSSGVSYLLGGFEDGTVVLWDLRVPRTELHSCELFTEPGKDDSEYDGVSIDLISVW